MLRSGQWMNCTYISVNQEYTFRMLPMSPMGPRPSQDYRARLDGVQWNFEVTRVLGDILENRRIFNQPRDARKVIDMAVQSPPIDERDVTNALDQAIKSKEGKRETDGRARNLCLVLLNVLELDIRSNSDVWNDMDLTEFDAVFLVNGYARPSVELMKGRFSKT